jgi:hypothetical protein
MINFHLIFPLEAPINVIGLIVFIFDECFNLSLVEHEEWDSFLIVLWCSSFVLNEPTIVDFVSGVFDGDVFVVVVVVEAKRNFRNKSSLLLFNVEFDDKTVFNESLVLLLSLDLTSQVGVELRIFAKAARPFTPFSEIIEDVVLDDEDNEDGHLTSLLLFINESTTGAALD